jgi:hypothetical protein
MSTRSFGFRQTPDVRDFRHSMAPVLAASPEDRRVIADWEIGPILNQGSEGACVGYGCRALLNASPFRQDDGPTAREIYLEARMVDEFDDSEEGTSVRAGLNILKKHGLIQSYVWATGVEDVYQFIAKKGPVVAGISWHGYETDSQFRMGFDTPLVGYHCILLTSFNRDKRIFGFQNSWGKSFGSEGQAYMTEQDLHRELTKRGGVCAGVIEKTV